MTKLGHPQLEKKMQQRMARLVQLHMQTHPRRVAAHFGVSPGYVRRLWRERPLDQMSTLREALMSYFSEESP